jgi:hypothetical protein
MTLILSALHSQLAQTLILIPLIAIVLDLVSGVASSIVNHTFSTKMLGDFAHHNLLPFVGILATAGIAILAGTAVPVAAAGVTAAMAAFTVSQVGSIAENVAEVTGLPYSFVSSVLSSLFHRGAKNAPSVTPAATIAPSVASGQTAAASATPTASAAETPASETPAPQSVS